MKLSLFQILALLLALAAPGAAEAQRAPRPRATLAARPGAQVSPQARVALQNVLRNGRLDRSQVRALLSNPHVAPDLNRTLVALDKVQNVPGAERVLRRLSKAGDRADAQGAAFELHAGAQLGSRLRELSATVRGHEVDAVLRDGTLVEMKSQQSQKPGMSRRLFGKALKQLGLRSRGEPVMLITNRDLHPKQLDAFRSRFGSRGQVLKSTESGLSSQ